MSVSSNTGLSIALLVGLISAAYAADLPSPLPPPPPPPAPALVPAGGFYLGAFGGWTSLNAPQTYSLSSPALASLTGVIPFVEGAGARSLGLRGTDAGVEAGYDFSFSDRLKVGLAADADYSGAHAANSFSGNLPPAGGSGPLVMNSALDRTWGASLRVRAGYELLDSLLIYATGGAAVGQFNYSQGYWGAGGQETENVVFHGVRPGWTIGGGAEWAFTRNWVVKAEYRHTEYSALNGSGTSALYPRSFGTATANHSTGTIREDGVRVGVDYRFP